MFWMDLRAEPLVLSVSEMEPERFYHFQLIDLYNHNFAYVGTLHDVCDYPTAETAQQLYDELDSSGRYRPTCGRCRWRPMGQWQTRTTNWGPVTMP